MISNPCWNLSNTCSYFSSVHSPFSSMTLLSLYCIAQITLTQPGPFCPHVSLIQQMISEMISLILHIYNINIYKSHPSSFSSFENEDWEVLHRVPRQSFPLCWGPQCHLFDIGPKSPQTIFYIHAIFSQTIVMLESLYSFTLFKNAPPLRTCPLETTLFFPPCPKPMEVLD